MSRICFSGAECCGRRLTWKDFKTYEQVVENATEEERALLGQQKDALEGTNESFDLNFRDISDTL